MQFNKRESSRQTGRDREAKRESARARERERSFVDNQEVTAGREKDGGRKGVRQIGREGGRRGERDRVRGERESCTLTQGCCSHPQHSELKIRHLIFMKKSIITGISQTTSQKHSASTFEWTPSSFPNLLPQSPKQTGARLTLDSALKCESL